MTETTNAPATEQEFIAIGPFAWGKGEVLETAVRNMRQCVPSYIPRGYGYKVYKGAKGCRVSEIDGGIFWVKGTAKPELVKEVKKRKR